MRKVVSSKKSNVSIFKRLLATAGLVLSMGLAVIPSTKAYAEEVLFEDTSSEDVNLTDATSNEVEQTNGNTTETRSEETVNDGTVDTSAGTNPDDAQRDAYNGDNNDYFDSYDKHTDTDPNGGEYIDSDDELTRKGLTPTPTPTPTPEPVPKTGDSPIAPVAGVVGLSGALFALYSLRNKALTLKKANAYETQENVSRKVK